MEQIREELNGYVCHKAPLGSFLTAVLENDLFGAMGKADDTNKHRIFEICQFIYNNLPHNIWGSKEKVAKHLEREGD